MVVVSTIPAQAIVVGAVVTVVREKGVRGGGGGNAGAGPVSTTLVAEPVTAAVVIAMSPDVFPNTTVELVEPLPIG